MSRPTKSQRNYITGLRSRVPGDHSGRGDVEKMTFIEAIAEIERLRQLEKQAIDKALDDFAAKGKEAWKDVPDASKFVEDLRKGDL